MTACWIVLGGDTEDAAGRVSGCQSGKGASSLSSIFPLASLYSSFFPFLPLPSFHASVLLFLAPRGSAAKANKQTSLFIPASGEQQRVINLALPCLGLPQPTNLLRRTWRNDSFNWGRNLLHLSPHTALIYTHTHAHALSHAASIREHKGKNAHCTARCATHTWRHEASQFVPNNHRN